MSRRVTFPRAVLLVEVERWCRDHACNARARLSLTKEEARRYTGFECPRCERRNEDSLTERDIPDWWEELKVASLEGLRPAARGGGEDEEPAAPVARMSDAWKALGEEAGGGGGDEAREGREQS
ncbi:MAG TPA: hypothetical protein VF668_18830 [Pyrinomonadaceae bacterium]|jgi:hypothetical protein